MKKRDKMGGLISGKGRMVMKFLLRKDCLGWDKCGLEGGGATQFGGTAGHRVRC